MLESLEILNGNLELKFDKYTYEYTVVVDNTITSLDFKYNVSDDYNINIRNNIINGDESIVYLDVYNIDEEYTYTFYVYTKKEDYVNGIEDYKKSLEINTVEEVSLYKVELLCVGIFLAIIIVFSIIFKKSKHN